MPNCQTNLYIDGRHSTLLINLLSFYLTVVLTSCTNTKGGGNFPSGWNLLLPGQPGTFTCDGASGQYA